LKKAEAAAREGTAAEVIIYSEPTNTLPWQRAEPMLEKLGKEQKVSSVSFTVSCAVVAFSFQFEGFCYCVCLPGNYYVAEAFRSPSNIEIL
jgi:hypothetical protein